MENSTSSISTIINNFDIQQVLSFNFSVFINFLIYPAAATFSILGVKEIIKYLHNKWISRYERRAEELKELNNKTHDRLVEIEEEIDLNKQSKKFSKIITRLRYNASRLKKYDKIIFDDIEKLLRVLSSDFKENKEVIAVEKKDQAKKLIEDIKERIDKLWVKKS